MVKLGYAHSDIITLISFCIFSYMRLILA